jgi:hypothetical protein
MLYVVQYFEQHIACKGKQNTKISLMLYILFSNLLFLKNNVSQYCHDAMNVRRVVGVCMCVNIYIWGCS